MASNRGTISILLVTPARNEENNILGLFETLLLQETNLFAGWMIVNDSSTDSTEQVVRALQEDYFPIKLLDFESPGSLISGGAYKSWMFGVNEGFKHFEHATHVMKLDADVRLDSRYFNNLIRSSSMEGISGGRITGKGREQNWHVPGPVKLYSRKTLTLVSQLPLMPGFDVMDEILAGIHGDPVEVARDAIFKLSRPIGLSEGNLHGRYRNGRVSRWTGYHFAYFFLHCLRYLIRKPFVIGSCAMMYGYITAPPSPYPQYLRTKHSELQISKLRALVSNPVKWIRNTYS